MQTYSFSFPSFIRDEFDKKFTRLNTKLAKMDDGNEVTIVGETYEDRKILKPEVRKHSLTVAHQIKAGANISSYIPKPHDYINVNFTNVEVSIPGVDKIEGYHFAGTINIQGDVKTIFSVNEDVNLSEVDVKVCHHCNVRRKRNRLHVFTEIASGEHKAIGSTCVHEYIGLNIDSVLHTFFNFYKEEDIYGSRGMGGAWGFPIEHLANATRVAFANSPSYIKGGTTKGIVDDIHQKMFHPSQYDADQHDEYHATLKTAPKVGNLLREVYGDMDATKSNFNSNVVEALFYTRDDDTRELRDFVVGKSRGIFVWAVFNALKSGVKVEAPKPTLPSYHVGMMGQKVEFQGEVTFTKVCSGHYGDSVMVKMVDAKGNQFVSFGTGKALWDLTEGDRHTFKGTVSKHDEYKGTKQTSLKRLTTI